MSARENRVKSRRRFGDNFVTRLAGPTILLEQLSTGDKRIATERYRGDNSPYRSDYAFQGNEITQVPSRTHGGLLQIILLRRSRWQIQFGLILRKSIQIDVRF
jgi:hypothetical protein